MSDIEEIGSPVHFARDNPRLLGETLVMAAQLCFVRGTHHHVTYDCNGQWLRFLATGTPFRVEVSEINNGERPIFRAENTGDGLTYVFEPHNRHTPITQLILHSAKDYVRRANRAL